MDGGWGGNGGREEEERECENGDGLAARRQLERAGRGAFQRGASMRLPASLPFPSLPPTLSALHSSRPDSKPPTILHPLTSPASAIDAAPGITCHFAPKPMPGLPPSGPIDDESEPPSTSTPITRLTATAGARRSSKLKTLDATLDHFTRNPFVSHGRRARSTLEKPRRSRCSPPTRG